MVKNRRINTNVVNVGFGRTVTTNFPIGPRIYNAVMAVKVRNVSGQIPLASELFQKLVLKINGVAVRTIDFAQYETMRKGWDAGLATQAFKVVNGFDTLQPLDVTGQYEARFFLNMHFAEDFRTDYTAKVFGAMFTRWADGYQFPSVSWEVTLGSGGTTIDPTFLPTVDCYLDVTQEVGPMVDPRTGLIVPANTSGAIRQDQFMFIDQTFIPYTGTGFLAIQTPFQLRDIISEILLFPSGTDTIGSLIVERNDVRIIDDLSIANLHARYVSQGWNASELYGNNVARIAFDADDIPTSGLVLGGAQSFLVRPRLVTVANAASMGVVTLRLSRSTI